MAAVKNRPSPFSLAYPPVGRENWYIGSVGKLGSVWESGYISGDALKNWTL